MWSQQHSLRKTASPLKAVDVASMKSRGCLCINDHHASFAFDFSALSFASTAPSRLYPKMKSANSTEFSVQNSANRLIGLANTLTRHFSPFHVRLYFLLCFIGLVLRRIGEYLHRARTVASNLLYHLESSRDFILRFQIRQKSDKSSGVFEGHICCLSLV